MPINVNFESNNVHFVDALSYKEAAGNLFDTKVLPVVSLGYTRQGLPGVSSILAYLKIRTHLDSMSFL